MFHVLTIQDESLSNTKCPEEPTEHHLVCLWFYLGMIDDNSSMIDDKKWPLR